MNICELESVFYNLIHSSRLAWAKIIWLKLLQFS